MNDQTIDTGGGAYVGGNIYTGGGQFVGGDQINIYQRAQPRLPRQKPTRALHFTNRKEELDKLLAGLRPGQVITLCGPGGIGKSALAAEAIWTLAPGDDLPEAFPDGIISCSFDDYPEASQALEHIILSLGEEPKPNPTAAAQRVLAAGRCCSCSMVRRRSTICRQF